MTLAELLVALAIGSALLGLVLGIFDSTARLAKSALRQEAVWNEALLIAQAIDKNLDAWIACADLAGGDPAWLLFSSDEIRFYSMADEPKRVRIFSRPDAERVAIETLAIEPDGAEGKIAYLGAHSEIQSRVRFRCAEAFSGLIPQWADSAAGPAAPVLIEYQIDVWDRSSGKPLRAALSGAVAMAP